MRWFIGSWLLIVGVCGLTSVQASQSARTWRISATPEAAQAEPYQAPHSRNQTAANVNQVIDLCAPCNYGGQCTSGLCPIDNATEEGVCSQKCSSDGSVGCPQGFTCYSPNDSTVSTCIANTSDVCPAIWVGAALNGVCLYPASMTGDANLAFSRPCADDLICLIPLSGIGSCLNLCSSIDPNYLCNPNQQCCFGLDANNACLASTSTQLVGGCIQIQSVADSCVEPDQQVCVAGADCANTGYSTTSKCYVDCSGSATSCPLDSTCAAINGNSICCDASQYNPDDQTTCFPVAGACKLQVGVACTSNIDCQTSQCKSYAGAKACSSPCLDDNDCPGVTADVNGDGVPDGGSRCLTIGGGTLNYCWPKTTPATQPNCFFIQNQEAATPLDSGCNCQGAPVAPVWGLLAVALGLRRGRRRHLSHPR